MAEDFLKGRDAEKIQTDPRGDVFKLSQLLKGFRRSARK